MSPSFIVLMASAARPTEKKERLLHILVREAAVEDDIARWIINNEHGPQCESPADFAQLWTKSTADSGPKVDVLDHIEPKIDTETFKGRKMMGRLRTAWDYCCHDHAGEAKELAAPPVQEQEDSRQLWPDGRRTSCENAVTKLYKVKLDPDVFPSSPIMNRLDRIWKDRTAEIILLEKMRTMADFDLIMAQPPKDRKLGGDYGEASLFLRMGTHELPPARLEATEQVIQAMEVMANGWLLLGTHEVTTKLLYTVSDSAAGPDSPSSSKVLEFDINDRDDWVKHARKMAKVARANGDSEACIVRYLRLREHQTRQVAIKYWRGQSFPWGQALKQALSLEMAVLWTVTGQTNGYGVQVSVPGITDEDGAEVRGQKRLRSPRRSPSPTSRPPYQPAQRTQQNERQQKQRTGIPSAYLGLASRDLLPHMLCTDFNGNGCHADRPSHCPQGRLHRCNFPLTDGTLCGSMSHCRSNCPNDPRNGGHGQRPAKASKGGKGGKSGKGHKGGKGAGHRNAY